MSVYSEKAAALRANVPCPNCAETIMMAFADRLGLSEETACALGTNLGGGMKTGSVCGAVTAGLLVLGALGVTAPASAAELQRTIMENHDGMINCKDLLRACAATGGVKKQHCDAMIAESIAIVEKLAGEQGKL